MSRGYRHIVLAAFGWLALTGQDNAAADTPKDSNQAVEQQRSTDTKQAADKIASAIRDTIQPVPQDEGCQDRSDQRQSDLCAQWKAADAASNAAQYALWTLLISAVGTGLLIWTLLETRKTSRRELRAYIYAKGLKWQGHQMANEMGIEVKVVWCNAGTTPAKKAELGTICAICEMSDDLHTPFEMVMNRPNGAHFGPKVDMLSPPVLISLDTIRKAWRAEHQIVIYARINYVDAFNVARETRVAYRLSFLMAIGRPLTLDSMLELRWEVVGSHNGADGD